ncbi:LIM domain protein [Ancylostoma caninum]|uniref:LIM domain protein n=1 Tax=Ancylostoma caninum TaxID=29170 RepID=A0A368FJ50_ANCCA|nr:LIM domain protein [Ancylostoma caninum]
MDLQDVECKSCVKPIPVGDVGIKTDHGPKDDIWHPNCFRCAQCDQLLVDMLYFYYQGKYYCGRHFADQQYPRCAGCDEVRARSWISLDFPFANSHVLI